MKHYLCITNAGIANPTTCKRAARSAADAAEQCAKALHTTYWTQPDGRIEYTTGHCELFAIHRSAHVCVGEIRVYEVTDK